MTLGKPLSAFQARAGQLASLGVCGNNAAAGPATREGACRSASPTSLRSAALHTCEHARGTLQSQGIRTRISGKRLLGRSVQLT